MFFILNNETFVVRVVFLKKETSGFPELRTIIDIVTQAYNSDSLKYINC